MSRILKNLFDYFFFQNVAASTTPNTPLVLFLESLSDSKSPQVSKTFLGILVDLNNAVV